MIPPPSVRAGSSQGLLSGEAGTHSLHLLRPFDFAQGERKMGA